jgi:hypothetical protein
MPNPVFFCRLGHVAASWTYEIEIVEQSSTAKIAIGPTSTLDTAVLEARRSQGKTFAARNPTKNNQ